MKIVEISVILAVTNDTEVDEVTNHLNSIVSHEMELLELNVVSEREYEEE